MVSRAITSVFLRPILSPKWPNSREPNGRARKETAKVTNDISVASAGLDLATEVKKIVPK